MMLVCIHNAKHTTFLIHPPTRIWSPYILSDDKIIIEYFKYPEKQRLAILHNGTLLVIPDQWIGRAYSYLHINRLSLRNNRQFKFEK